MIPFNSIAALLLLAGAGCTSVRSPGNDEAKVVARVLAKSASAPLAFGDHAGAQQLVSSLDTSEYFGFGVILDAQKKVFASYSRPDQISGKEKFLARITQSPPSDEQETLIADQGVAIAIVRIGSQEKTIGYVAIGRKRR